MEPFMPHNRLPALQCARVHWTEKLTARQSGSKSCGLFNAGTLRQMMLSKNFRHWPAELHANQLLGSAEPGNDDTLNRAIDQLLQTDDMVIRVGSRVHMLSFVWTSHEFQCSLSFHCMLSENWVKSMRHCQIQRDFKGSEYLCKLAKNI